MKMDEINEAIEGQMDKACPIEKERVDDMPKKKKETCISEKDENKIPDTVDVKTKEAEKKPVSDKDKIEELTNLLKRTQADFINYRKRAEKEADEFRKYAEVSFVKKLLPIVDSFEMALKNCTHDENFVKGIELIYAQLFGALKEMGLKPIDAVGKRFDPYLHEVMLKEKSDKETDVILEELQKGYFFKEKVLRYSKVKVSDEDN